MSWAQHVSASSMVVDRVFCRQVGRIWLTRVEEPAAEAKKADGASCAALQIPSPPCFTGREVWVQAGSFSWNWMLVNFARDGFELIIIDLVLRGTVVW